MCYCVRTCFTCPVPEWVIGLIVRDLLKHGTRGGPSDLLQGQQACREPMAEKGLELLVHGARSDEVVSLEALAGLDQHSPQVHQELDASFDLAQLSQQPPVGRGQC